MLIDDKTDKSLKSHWGAHMATKMLAKEYHV